MKKFLCYDTNDAASGKIGVNSNGVLSPNATVPSTNGSIYQQLVTDGSGNVKWEDRLAYDKKTVLVDQTKVTNGGIESRLNTSLLVNGTPVTVNIDGTEYNATLEEGGTYYVGSYTNTCYYHIGGSASIDTNVPSHMSTTYYPFFVVIYEDGNCMVLFNGEVAGTEHTFGVCACKIKQIDPKYIPATIPSANGSAHQYLVTDGDGNAKWEDRLAYEKGRKNLLVINFAWIDNDYRIETGDMATQFQDICDNYREVMVAIGGQDLLMTTGFASGEYFLSYNNEPIIRNYIGGSHPYLIHLDNESSIGIVENSLGDEATVTLYVDGGVKQIDPKYIPDTTVKVNITANEDGTPRVDKTFNEIKTLIDSGVDVKCIVNNVMVLDYVFNEGGEAYGFEFNSVALNMVVSVVFTPDGLVTNQGSFDKFVFPKVTTSDNNKFLRVVNGAWQASSDIIVPSSTSGSSKKFKITVDDSGAITATEV